MRYIFFLSVIFFTSCDLAFLRQEEIMWKRIDSEDEEQKEIVWQNIHHKNEKQKELASKSINNENKEENNRLKEQLEVYETIASLYKSRISEFEDLINFYQNSINNLTKYEGMYHESNISGNEKKEQIDRMHQQKNT